MEILAFCFQEKTYDRVNWNFLLIVHTRMQIPTEFINLVRLLLHDTILHVKVNEHKGAPFKPSDKVKQGCGLYPLLYILVIQTPFSLIHTANGQPGSNTAPFEGIPLPPARRGDLSTRTHARVSAYAHDLIGATSATPHNSPPSSDK